MFIATSSELEKENKDRIYTTSSSLNSEHKRNRGFRKGALRTNWLKLQMLHPGSKPCLRKYCVLYVLNKIILQAPAILSTNIISVTANII